MNAKKTTMLFSVTERGKGKRLMKMLNDHNIRVHFQSVGTGTAPSDVMDILGLGSSDKDVILSFATYADVEALAERLSGSLGVGGIGGLLIILSPSAVGNLFSAIVSHHLPADLQTERSKAMESAYQFSLILVAVNQGHSEHVMHTARRAGATGGTVIRARLDDSQLPEQFSVMAGQAEKELVTILASETTRDKILEEVNREFGLRTDAKGVVLSLPVEKAFKI